MTGTRRCEVCGGPVNRNNTLGVCRTTPECNRECTRRRRAANGPGRLQKKECNRPGCTKEAGSHGVCPMHDRRFKETGEYGPAESTRPPLVINPGDTYGRWTVLESYSTTHQRILCRCECGTERHVLAYILRIGESKSCGCGRGPKPRTHTEPYMRVGETSERLTALEDAFYGSDAIRFRCGCGAETVKNAGLVKRGQTRSCGCLRTATFQTHGLSKHPLYHIWKGILRRCENPQDPGYEHYGADGITICEGWHGLPDGFLSFAADLGERPARHTVDRLNNDGGYWCGHCAECIAKHRPANAAWRTPKQQNANRRSVRPLARERDTLAARVDELEALLAKCTCGTAALAQGALF